MNRTYLLISFFLFSLLLVSCKQDLEVIEEYEFEVTHLPYFDNLDQGESGEVRCNLTEEKHFIDRQYTIRYFPTTGVGTMRIGRLGREMSPNDRYSIYPGSFTLYYLPASSGRHNIEVVFESDDGRSKILNLSFNVAKEQETKM